MRGRMRGKGPKLAIREGETAKLVAGPPLKVEAKAVRKGDKGTIEVSLIITGVKGETYRGQPDNRKLAKARFEILDSSGEEITSQEFDYG